MKSIYLFLALLFVCIVCCRQQDRQNTLYDIDSLVSLKQYDEAFNRLGKFDYKHCSSAETVYYYLLSTEVNNYMHLSNSDSLINESVAYYKHNGPKELYTRALLCAGIVLYKNGDFNKSIEHFKLVEETANTLIEQEYYVKSLIYLAIINVKTNNKNLASEYALKGIEEAMKTKNRKLIGNSFQNASTILTIAGKAKGIDYMVRSIDYITDQDKQDLPIYLKNIGVDYYENGNYVESEKYLQMSLKEKTMPETLGSLADLYSKQGKLDEAARLWKDALTTNDLRLKVVFMTSYVDWLREKEDYKAEAEYSRELIALKDSLARWQQTEATREIQEQYDREVAERKHQAFVNRLLWIMALMTVIVLGVIAFAHFRGLKAKKQLAESNALAAEYSAQIERLKAEGKEQTKEAKELQGKLEKLRAEQNEILYHGKQLYDHMMKEGGNAATWHKADFTDFVEYYRTIDMPFVVHLENDYQKLSPSNKTILIFQHMGYTDQQILYLMGMTDGALRTTKSRIKGRRKE